MYKWVIIGGGIQGCTVASYLLHSKKADTTSLRVIDPYEEPLHRWKTLTKRVGMKYLRSTSVHHLDPDPHCLRKFSKKEGYAQPFIGRYDRPRLDLFNEYHEGLFQQYEWNDFWMPETVTGLEKRLDGWVVKTDRSTIAAEKVILAIGVNDRPHFPEWADPSHERMGHLFSAGEVKKGGSLVIVGGGISAAHLANTYAKEWEGEVTLLKRHPFRIKDFDSDPGWLGPKYMNDFHKVTCYEKRREIIKAARHRGSITSGLSVKLNRHVRDGRLTIKTDQVEAAVYNKDHIHLRLKDNEGIKAQTVLLATGAENGVPGMEWLNTVVDSCALRTAPCGFPVVDAQLEWGPGLYVAGALAELEIGPSARNIAGARRAAERITAI
ncbi:FAD/NAD(P)-binding protein [Halobacillus sp. Nhm2S1]|uniref:NAD(P)-binding domain-containing protein n=1 Tax=Halobacillus sp. Nhm2S1 TaxID=2866716 RepID=UPI001C73DC51|nr:FAD/NAD(P)-binding protein [Halobacillus sp. Nhm2S1]MBX0358402.1 FAD/NAD(P)-binding protein [Halobacillus sp. Nhm2S1]